MPDTKSVDFPKLPPLENYRWFRKLPKDQQLLIAHLYNKFLPAVRADGEIPDVVQVKAVAVLVFELMEHEMWLNRYNTGMTNCLQHLSTNMEISSEDFVEFFKEYLQYV